MTARRRPIPRTANAHAWAEHIRQQNPAIFGASHCDDPADLYTSEFRRWARLPAIHLCRLRELAREQARAHGDQGQATATTSLEDAA